MTIAQEVTAFRAGLPDSPVMQTFERDRRRLASSDSPTVTLGGAIGAVELLDAHGDPTTLADALAGRPAVVVFYRGTWCPYCNIALRAYRDDLAGELEARGVALVAVSPQTPDRSLTMQETNELAFPVLSDPGNALASELGIVMRSPDEVLAAQREIGTDLAAVNAAGDRVIPMPTVLVLDGAGTVRWADVQPDYTARTEPPEILAAVDSELTEVTG